MNSFDDVRRLIAGTPEPSSKAVEKARAREGQLTKPPGALGRLEDLAAWLSAWQGRHPPKLDRVAVLVFAGNHGVVAQGVSAWPSDVTAQMVGNFLAGGAAINQLAQLAGAELRVVPLELDRPTRDFTAQPAMDEAECLRAFNAGFALDGDLDLVAVGEMGIGNTTTAAALSAALFGGDPASWVGPGAGADEAGVRRKADAVARALRLHGPAIKGDPLRALARVGGRELAAMTGAILAARLQRTPVVLDGYVATAAAAVLHNIDPGATAHCVAGHLSAEPAHAKLLERMGLTPLLNMNMRLGEASGAALAIPIIRAAAACHNGMATFEEAAVSAKKARGER